MRYTMWGGAAVLGAALALAVAAPASADHAAPELTAGQPGDCGAMAISTGGWLAETHQVATAVLVVQAAGEQQTAQVGESITVGPFDTAEATVRWRLWGGGERDYDSPPLADLPALLAYLEENPGGELDPGAPGLAWHELVVEGCEPEPSPSPSPSAGLAPGPTDPAAPGQAGGGDDAGKPALPTTGDPLLLIAGAGVGLSAAGGGLYWLAWRRATFTA